MDHILNIFSGISLLVVVKLSFVTKKFPFGEEVGLFCGMSYLFYIMKSLVPLCYYLYMVLLLFVIFVSWLFLLLLFVNGSFFHLCGNAPGHIFYVFLHDIVLKYCICCI